MNTCYGCMFYHPYRMNVQKDDGTKITGCCTCPVDRCEQDGHKLTGETEERRENDGD